MSKPLLLRASLWLTLATLAATTCAWGATSEWTEDEGLVVTVGAPFVELRLFAGRGYPRFHAVERNEKLNLFKSRGDWYKAETEDGKIGWLHRNDLHRAIYDEEGYRLNFSPPDWSLASANPGEIGLTAGERGGAIAYTVTGGYRFTPNIAAELRYSQAFGDFSNTKFASFALTHQAFPSWRVSPFLALGAGVIKTYPDAILVEAEDRQDNVLTFGGGFRIHLTHSVLVRIEYNKHTLLTTREYNEEVEEWKAGFSVLF